MSTIPVQDLPREKILFNHLIDELERTPIMAHKVLKDCEAPLHSHRRTTNWLWEKVELVLPLGQQRKNRIEFDKQLNLKPAEGYLGAPAPKNANPKSKADKGKKRLMPKLRPNQRPKPRATPLLHHHQSQAQPLLGVRRPQGSPI